VKLYLGVCSIEVRGIVYTHELSLKSLFYSNPEVLIWYIDLIVKLNNGFSFSYLILSLGK